jgi:hypothetical protein
VVAALKSRLYELPLRTLGNPPDPTLLDPLVALGRA